MSISNITEVAITSPGPLVKLSVGLDFEIEAVDGSPNIKIRPTGEIGNWALHHFAVSRSRNHIVLMVRHGVSNSNSGRAVLFVDGRESLVSDAIRASIAPIQPQILDPESLPRVIPGGRKR